VGSFLCFLLFTLKSEPISNVSSCFVFASTARRGVLLFSRGLFSRSSATLEGICGPCESPGNEHVLVAEFVMGCRCLVFTVTVKIGATVLKEILHSNMV
jgi:hypothetical protein